MSFLSDLRAAPPAGRTIALTAAALGITYGYDISNIAAALLFLEKDFGLDSNAQALMATSAVVGQIVGALLGGPLTNAIGRKRAMLLVAAGYVVFAVLSAVSPTAVLLLIVRLLLGVTIGLSITVVPVFVAESAPSAVRGGLLVAYQVAVVIGIVLGYIVGWGLSFSGSWQAMLGVAAIPAAVVFLMLFRLTETPSWLLMKGREDEAVAALRSMETPDRVDAELSSMKEALASLPTGSAFSRLAEMFRGYLLRASLFAIGLGLFIQITGINATIYYAPKIFEQMGFQGNTQQLLLPALVQLVSLVAVIVSMLIIDQVGRRRVLVIGISVMIVSDALLVAVYAMSGFRGSLSEILGLIGLMAFTLGYTFGFGAIVWVFAGEIFPSRYRALGSSLVLTADLVANAIVAQFFPPLLDVVGGAGVFTIFGILAVAALAFVLWLAPETKGRSLDDIQSYWRNGGKWPTGQESTPA